MMYVIPSKEYKLANPKGVKGDNFTGIIVFKDYDEEVLLEAWRLDNGQVTGVEIPQKTGKTKKGGRLAYWCVTVQYGYYDCPSGANADGTTKLGGAQRRESAIMEECSFVVTSTEEHCFDSYSDGSGSGGEENGGYFESQLPSGSGGGGFQPESYENAYNHALVDNFILEYKTTLNLSELEIDYLKSFPQLVVSIKAFIKLFGTWAFRAESFIEDQLISTFSSNVLRPEERMVLRSRGWLYYDINLIAYTMNAIWVTHSDTDLHFPQSQYPDVWMNGQKPSTCSDCRGNAYKHALFAAYNSHVFESSSFAKQLGDAHEGPDTGMEREIGSQMDLENNTAGYNVFDNSTTIHSNTILDAAADYQTAVMKKFNEGKLKYIKTINGKRVMLSTIQL